MKQFKSFFKQNKKEIVQLISCFSLVFLLLGLGRISAYFVSQSINIKNSFMPGIVTCEILEDFNGSEKSNVRIKNTGNTEAYVRCFIVATWMNDEGEVYGESIPVPGEDFEIILGDSWGLGDDGYYYYPNVVLKDKETPNLIESCVEVEGQVPNGYHLSVEIIASAVQANPDKKTKLWN